jgi:hypothetical protein
MNIGYMRVVQIKPIRGTSTKYGWLQMIIWLCAWYTSGWLWTVQQNRHITTIGNSVTSLNAGIQGVEFIQTGPMICHLDSLFWGLSTLNHHQHSINVEPSEIFILPSRESVLACSWEVSQCCRTRPIPICLTLSRTHYISCIGTHNKKGTKNKNRKVNLTNHRASPI